MLFCMKKLLIALVLTSPLWALEEEDLVWDAQIPSVTDYNAALQEAVAAQDWWSVIDYADTIAYHYPDSPFGQDAAYQCAEAYFKMGQYELANQCLTNYLNQPAPKHFEEAIEYKFTIAELFRNGTKLRLFESHKMPQLLPAEEEAVKLYDEVITTLPHHEMAASSLMGKAKIQVFMEDFRPSVETFQLLIRRFPKHELAAQAYLEINRSYLLQSQIEHLDLDLLDLAEMNMKKFHVAFPREERLEEAEKLLSDMRELYAANLLDTGRYYEKIKKTPASIIYYTKVVAKYPTTMAAKNAREKLEHLQADGHL